MWLICGDGKSERRFSAQSKSGRLGIRESVEKNDSAAFHIDQQGLRKHSSRIQDVGVDVTERTLMATYQTFRVDKLCPSDYSVRETWYGDEV